MRCVTQALVIIFLVSIASVQGQKLRVQGTHIMRGHDRFFLSGANTAWVAYGYDFGNHQYQQRRAEYLSMMDAVSRAGGNSMRTWVHIHGATSPQFDSSGHVTGLDRDGSFLADFKRYLDDARDRNLLIFPCLWNGAVVHDYPERMRGLITDTSKLQSYIDNALIPWVQAVKDHPALGGWDIINEIEGFIKPGSASQACETPNGGWAGHLYSAHDLQRFINWQADAIRRTDPEALVTAGSSSQNTNTDHFGHHNLYSDSCLTRAGGKSQGVLNVYSTHTYEWAGRYADEAPFKHNAADYGLDKPLVIAEFSQVSGAGMTSAQQFQWAYDHGYAGAWSWMMKTPGGDGADTPAVQAQGMESIRHRNDQSKGGLVALTLH